MIGEMVWCPTCRRRREVEDEFSASEMTRSGEMEYAVTALECGHQIEGVPHRVADAPGAPYAGPGVAVAATHRPRDLLAAQRRAAELEADPFD